MKQPAPAGRPSGSGSAPSSTAGVNSSSPDPITGNPLHPLNPLNPANQVYYVAPAPEPARHCSEAGAGRDDSARLVDCSPSRDSGGWGGGSDYSSSDSSSPSSDNY
ncbi:hypothetical protein [Pseudomonas alloputida]|uniref:hypothetical protein n=1 Tax=Pseudomonas alloputida TaxID=1940621 RepID=UPI003866CE00